MAGHASRMLHVAAALAAVFAAALAALPALPAAAQTQTGYGDFPVTVRKSAGMVIIDVSMPVAATQREAWDVLTDYDHMAAFFPNLTASRVAARTGNTLRIEQKGRVSYGPFSFPFESVREIELFPTSEIRSKAISGSLKKGDAITRLVPDGTGTRILYHNEAVPNVWVPPAIGPKVIEGQTRRQFESLRDEIMSRKRSRNGAR